MVESIVNRIIDFITANLWDSINFWRISTIVLFFLALFTFTFRNYIFRAFQNEKRQAHDRDMFNKSDQLFNERQLSNWIEVLGTNRMLVGQSKKAMQFYYFFREEGNQYLDSKLKKACTKFVKKLDELLVFAAQHFFVYPNNQPSNDIDNNQLALYPEILHGSPKTPGYQHAIECQHKLHTILDDIENLYQKYRILIKNKLIL